MDWTHRELRLLREMDEQGALTTAQMAARLGRSYHAVHDQIGRQRRRDRERGLPLRRPLKRVPLVRDIPDVAERIRTLHARGLHDADIALRLEDLSGREIHPACITRWRYRLGLPSLGITATTRERMRRSQSYRQEDPLLRINRKNRQLAAALGWPGRTYGEARVLDALKRLGPRTGPELAVEVQGTWGTAPCARPSHSRGQSHLAKRLNRLEKAGLVKRRARNTDGKRLPDLWLLADASEEVVA